MPADSWSTFFAGKLFVLLIMTDRENLAKLLPSDVSGAILRLGLHLRKLFRIRDESGTFLYRIAFAVHTQEDRSEM